MPSERASIMQETEKDNEQILNPPQDETVAIVDEQELKQINQMNETEQNFNQTEDIQDINAIYHTENIQPQIIDDQAIYQQLDDHDIVEQEYNAGEQDNFLLSSPEFNEGSPMTMQNQKPSKDRRIHKDGRSGYKGGQLRLVYQTKKEKYIQDGSEMIQVQREVKQQEEKIRALQTRIKALQRQEEKSTKRVQEVQVKLSANQNTNQTLSEIKSRTALHDDNKGEEAKKKKEKVSEMRLKLAESKEKLKNDIKLINSLKRQTYITNQIELDQKMRENQLLLRMEKEQKIQEIKAQKERAAQKRNQQEIQFLGRIQHQYHKEKDQKVKYKEEQEELIARLELEESKLLESIKNTQSLEQQLQIRDFNKAFGADQMSQVNYSPNSYNRNQGMNSSHLGRIFQTPKTLNDANNIKSLRSSGVSTGGSIIQPRQNIKSAKAQHQQTDQEKAPFYHRRESATSNTKTEAKSTRTTLTNQPKRQQPTISLQSSPQLMINKPQANSQQNLIKPRNKTLLASRSIEENKTMFTQRNMHQSPDQQSIRKADTSITKDKNPLYKTNCVTSPKRIQYNSKMDFSSPTTTGGGSKPIGIYKKHTTLKPRQLIDSKTMLRQSEQNEQKTDTAESEVMFEKRRLNIETRRRSNGSSKASVKTQQMLDSMHQNVGGDAKMFQSAASAKTISQKKNANNPQMRAVATTLGLRKSKDYSQLQQIKPNRQQIEQIQIQAQRSQSLTKTNRPQTNTKIARINQANTRQNENQLDLSTNQNDSSQVQNQEQLLMHEQRNSSQVNLKSGQNTQQLEQNEKKYNLKKTKQNL
ncbi:UNKNOWN [Stylonychia lemnae]|uniref:Uncharacterized protein n=1 Tax=Stylonychia lemnae TaxID=5949 RepID=A0A078B1S9_STYLE|nr:UNKNOWN [Stylonychia lemnae]|eukprot:CDW87248.1 UNKNOWN [Stylonychia lemnae]